jgi:FAD/FMN-containing dehydrogenase
MLGTNDLPEDGAELLAASDPGGLDVEAHILDDATMGAFRTCIRGEVLVPDDGAYDRARAVFNSMIDRRPAIIVRCAGVSDVVRGVDLARTNDLTLSVRSGGHGVAGWAVSDGGVMLDLSPMKGIRVDPGRRMADAQAGLTLAEFDHETQAFGLATTMGVVSMTGIAGLTLGGGLGWLNGKHALACDNVISADVVTATGELVTASADRHEDLFWALRGGGGNFGVVTSFRYQLHPVRMVVAGSIVYTPTRTRDALRSYHEFASACPPELSTHGSLFRGPDGRPTFAVGVCYSGTPEAAETVLRPLRRIAPVIDDDIGPMEYEALQHRGDTGFPPGQQHYWKSSFLKHLGDGAMEVMIAFVEQMPSSNSGVGLQHLHGAAARVPRDATAFPHRDSHHDFLILSQWPDPADSSRNIEWTRRFFEAMTPFLEPAVYVNNLGEGDPRVREAFGANYDRLVALKATYDPTDLFRARRHVRPVV